MNLPNAISAARILMVPIFLVFAYRDGDAAALGAFGLFVAASLSDSLDGYLARSRGLITPLGQFLDPLADKLLVGAALVALVATRGFPLWAALIIAVREVAVQILRIRIVNGGGVLPASAAAKAKTFLQIVMVSWWLLPWTDTNLGHWVWLGGALLTTVTSGAAYFRASRAEGKEVEEEV